MIKGYMYPNKTKAIIVDIDGTLTNDKWRRHLVHSGKASWDDIHTMSKYDVANEWCLSIINSMQSSGYRILFVTARNEKYREDTISWINNNFIGTYELYMRPKEDKSEDWIVKKNLYFNHIEPFYEVEFCIEDRESVARMWRDLHLVCLHCDGDH